MRIGGFRAECWTFHCRTWRIKEACPSCLPSRGRSRPGFSSQSNQNLFLSTPNESLKAFMMSFCLFCISARVTAHGGTLRSGRAMQRWDKCSDKQTWCVCRLLVKQDTESGLKWTHKGVTNWAVVDSFACNIWMFNNNTDVLLWCNELKLSYSAQFSSTI